MNPTEAIPLLVVVLLLVSVGGGGVDRMTVTFQGTNDVEQLDGVHVVAGGTTTIPPDSAIDGDLYVIGGTARVEGGLDGDVTVLAGNLSVRDTATITGALQTVSGTTTVADGATVGAISTFEPPTPTPSPVRRVGWFLVQFLLLGGAGWWLVRQRPRLLDTVGHSVTNYTLVSGVVGALAAVTLLVLFVYMAFTLLLLPVSVLGLLAQLGVVLYGQVVFGYVLGTWLPVERPGVATVAGIGVFLLGMELLGAVPYLGALVQAGVVAVGFGAVLNTYFGLQRFEPVALPGDDGRQ